jgi:hypothetical protein
VLAGVHAEEAFESFEVFLRDRPAFELIDVFEGQVGMVAHGKVTVGGGQGEKGE